MLELLTNSYAGLTTFELVIILAVLACWVVTVATVVFLGRRRHRKTVTMAYLDTVFAKLNL